MSVSAPVLRSKHTVTDDAERSGDGAQQRRQQVQAPKEVDTTSSCWRSTAADNRLTKALLCLQEGLFPRSHAWAVRAPTSRPSCRA